MKRFPIPVTVAATALLLLAAGAAGANKPPKKTTTAITLAAKQNPLTFGSYVTLSGRLTAATRGGQTATLQVDPYPFSDTGFADKATKSTAANGDYTFTQAPGLNSRYRVVASASPTVTSPTVTTSVAYRVGLNVSDSTPRKGSRVRFSGSVGPKKDGATAFIQKRRSDGSFVTVARAPLSAGTETHSVYAKSLLINASGTYRVRVSADASHVTGTSRTRTLTIH
jgi:hypothetical protein